jgi:bifunctional non-homologous end joining protein LigD
VIPHPERILFPRDGISRAELAVYYAQAGPALLPHWRERAITVRRWPHGIDQPGFYQKHAGRSGLAGDGAPRIHIGEVETLVTWVGWGAIEFHVPLHRDGALHDWAVLDLDPNPPAGWEEVLAVGEVVVALLKRVGLSFNLKTSGGDGLHFYLPIVPTPAGEVTGHMEVLARIVAATAPRVATVTRRVAARGARVYVDYLQNGPARTMAGVFTVRARDGAPVSYPVTWEEIQARTPRDYGLRHVLGRPWPAWPTAPAQDLARAFAQAGLPSLAAVRQSVGGAGVGGGRCHA